MQLPCPSMHNFCWINERFFFSMCATRYIYCKAGKEEFNSLPRESFRGDWLSPENLLIVVTEKDYTWAHNGKGEEGKEYKAMQKSLKWTAIISREIMGCSRDPDGPCTHWGDGCQNAPQSVDLWTVLKEWRACGLTVCPPMHLLPRQGRQTEGNTFPTGPLPRQGWEPEAGLPLGLEPNLEREQVAGISSTA